MPIMEYECPKCGALREVIEKYDEPSKQICEIDKKRMKRIISICGWELKGDGWFNPHNPTKK